MDHFAAFADPTRRSIVALLAANGKLPASEISKHFTTSAPAISQHLKVLREARVLRMEKHAQQRIYSIEPASIAEMEEWLHTMRHAWNARFDALETLLKREQEHQ